MRTAFVGYGLFAMAFGCILGSLVETATRTQLAAADAKAPAVSNPLTACGLKIVDEHNQSRVSSLVSGELGGTWYSHPEMKSQVCLYADKQQGACLVFYSDPNKPNMNGAPFAIAADKDGVRFQVADADGKPHVIPVEALLKLEKIKD